MEFWKAHGTANDFVVLSDLDDDLDLSADLVRALCDRRRGIGGDGVLRIVAGRGDGVFMDYRNADGSIGEMCGNGVRVVARFVADHDLVPITGDRLVVETRAGDRATELHRDAAGAVAAVTVDMGAPILLPSDVPFEAAEPSAPARDVEVTVNGGIVRLSAVSMGNPHGVIEVADVDAAPVRSLGPRLEVHERFPKHTNVEFVQVVSDTEVRLRVWERGVGETASCGTGICAAVVALQGLGKVGPQVDVHVPGGRVEVRYDPAGHPSVWMTGPAVEVAHGRLDPAWITTARSGPHEVLF